MKVLPVPELQNRQPGKILHVVVDTGGAWKIDGRRKKLLVNSFTVITVVIPDSLLFVACGKIWQVSADGVDGPVRPKPAFSGRVPHCSIFDR